MEAVSLITPDEWATTLARPCTVSSDGGWRSGLVRRWTGGSGEIAQPPIDHHYIVMHLGGPKQVTRKGAGQSLTVEVDEGALTFVPAGTRYDWSTIGPIDFAHLYVHPARLNDLLSSKYDGDPTAVALDERVGVRDPLLTEVFRELLRQVASPGKDAHSYSDALMDIALAQLAYRHSNTPQTRRSARYTLAPRRLRRVLDYLNAHLAQIIRLDDLAGVAGLSRFHFSRSFLEAMGEPPMTYVTHRRLELAKRLLRIDTLCIAEVAAKSGLGAPSQFAATFRRQTGLTPSEYRRQQWK